jgi:putative two-component system response regulator
MNTLHFRSSGGNRVASAKASSERTVRDILSFGDPRTQEIDLRIDYFENGAPPPPASDRPESASVHRILIVDDESSNRTLLTMALASAELECEEAGDGVSALEALQSRPFDLVVLDIDMPRMKGTEVLKRLRANTPWPHLKVIMISGRATPDEMANMMLAGADDYLAKPFSRTQLLARVMTALHLKDAQVQSDEMHRLLVGANRVLEHNLHARDNELIHARDALVIALAELVACRDNETGDHLMRLQRYSRLLAEAAATLPAFAGQIDAKFIELLECCAPLHDIGKAAIPDHILLKRGKLSIGEFAVMKTHTVIGADILRKVAKKHGFSKDFLDMATNITRHHHERFDGNGYPDRLSGNDIPLAARIVAIADVYDAMRSRRVYKPALPHADVVETMLHDSVGHFDPALIEAFVHCAPKFEELFDTSIRENSPD